MFQLKQLKNEYHISIIKHKNQQAPENEDRVWPGLVISGALKQCVVSRRIIGFWPAFCCLSRRHRNITDSWRIKKSCAKFKKISLTHEYRFDVVTSLQRKFSTNQHFKRKISFILNKIFITNIKATYFSNVIHKHYRLIKY